MMKKVLSAVLSLALCISPVSGIHNVYAADAVSSGVTAQKDTKAADSVYEAFESGAEKVGVMVSFTHMYDEEVNKKIQVEADKYVDSIDKEKDTKDELAVMWGDYANRLGCKQEEEYL